MREFNLFLAALVTVLFIIIFCLYQREQSAVRKLRRAEKTIQDADNEIAELKSGFCSQDTKLGMCQNDLNIKGKSTDTEIELAALKADIEDSREKLTKAEEELKLHKHLTFELKRAIDNAPCGFGIAVPAHAEDASRLLTRIDDQKHLIQQLRGQILDREARINGLTKRMYMMSGMY